MKKTAEIELIICDECGKSEILGDVGDSMAPDVPAGWLSGTVVDENRLLDEGPAEWAACKPAHIKNAILTVLDLR